MSITTSRLKLEAKIHREAHDLRDGFGIFAVHMEDRDLKHLGDVGGISAGARLARDSGETDLIVDDDVQRAADGVAGELAEVQRFLHHAFAGECRVAVNQQSMPLLAFGVADAILLGADAAQGDRIHKFEMAGIETERQMDFCAGGGRPIGAVAEMIFHVAAAGL